MKNSIPHHTPISFKKLISFIYLTPPYRQHLLISIIGTLGIILITICTIHYTISAYRTNYLALTKQQDLLLTQEQQRNQQQKINETKKRRSTQISLLLTYKKAIDRLLNHLMRELPDNIQLQAFTWSNKKIHLTLQSHSLLNIPSWINQPEQLVYFKQANVDAIEKNNDYIFKIALPMVLL